MSAKLIFFCICLCVWTSVSSAARFQGPAGEVINRPPPVDETAAARAQQAARLRKQAAIADQVELALKSANAAVHSYIFKPFDPERAKFLSQAEADYRRAENLQPRDWRAFSGLGDVYYFEGRYGDSELAYKRAIALKPSDAVLYYVLARTYANDRKVPERSHALERSIQLDPSTKNHDAYYELAWCYDYLKLYDKAIVMYKRLLALLPRSEVGKIAAAHDSMASIYEHANRFSEAIEEYKECIRLKPDDAGYYFDLGIAYAHEKRYSEAIDAYQQAKKLDNPQSAHADIRIGEVYGETQDYDKAVAAFTRATKLEPNNFETFGALGYVYYLQKQYAKSVEAFQHAVRLKPEVPGTHYYLGLSQLMLGHKSEALQQYEELKNLKSDFADKLLSEINKQ